MQAANSTTFIIQQCMCNSQILKNRYKRYKKENYIASAITQDLQEVRCMQKHTNASSRTSCEQITGYIVQVQKVLPKVLQERHRNYQMCNVFLMQNRYITEISEIMNGLERSNINFSFGHSQNRRVKKEPDEIIKNISNK